MKILFVGVLALATLLAPPQAQGTVFANPTAITFATTTPGGIPGVSSPYPSTITVSGLAGTISALTVTLTGLNHDRPDDIQILLVGPTGAKYVLLADAGGTTTPASGVTLTFADSAASQVADAGPLTSGTYRPTCIDFQNTINTDFPSPAPVGPYSVAAPRGTATLASTFNGLNPNGTWSLYIVDDIANPTPINNISGGWSLDISASAPLQSTITTLTAAPNPSFTTAPDNNVTFTATVTSSGNPVLQGTVTFRDGATIIGGPTALNGSGQANLGTAALTEGSHNISAEYSGTAAFAVSSSSLMQVVNTRTTVVSNQFWNLGGLVVPDTGAPSPANVYPSQIFVSGLSGSLTKLTVTLSNVSHLNPDDFKVLLVGPTGAEMVLLGNIGGSTQVGNLTMTLDDAAANLLPDAGPLVSGTFRPTFVASSAAIFPSPAPSGPFNQAAPGGAATLASTFNSSTPNGTWRLYVVDDLVGNGSGSIGAWGLTFTTSSDAATVTTVAASANPSVTGQSVTFTATVRKSSDNAVVTAGTVTFREGGTVFAGPLALSGSGTATFSTAALPAALPAGSHVITADYSGSAGNFNLSSGSVVQVVDTATVVSGTKFLNPGSIQVLSGQTAAIYPARILVTNLPTDFCKLSVTISNLTVDMPDDVELLLVSPTGAKLVLLSDAGGTATAVNNVTLIFRDDAANLVPDSGPMTSGTFKPTAVASTPVNFPLPAPAGPYQHPLPTGGATLSSTFGGTAPNGYWNLYVVDDVLGGTPLTISGGWALEFIYPPAASVGGSQTIVHGGSSSGLGGNAPNGGSGTWSVVSGGTGTFSPNATTPNATFNHVSGGGPITLRWTLTDPSCGSSAADLVVVVLPSTNLVLNSAQRGWYDASGFHGPGNNNYFAGKDGNIYRNWFVFNIPVLPGPLVQAELRINSFTNASPSGGEIYQLRHVATSINTLTAGGSGLTGIYADLGDGISYGARTFTPPESGRYITMPLNAALRAAVSAAAGAPLALGGEITTLEGAPELLEYAFGYSFGGPEEAQLVLTVGTGDLPQVGYYTDGNPASTGPETAIQSAGFAPVQIQDIAAQDLTDLRLLLLNESLNSPPTAALAARLPEIESWVRAGGRLVVHDRGAGIPSPNPFLRGTPGLGTVSAFTSDLNVVTPATTLVTAGPFGIVTDTSLDGGSSSAHGYVSAPLLPPQARAILNFGGNTNQITAFSYPLGAGFIYYSTIPLDCYLPGSGCSINVIAGNLQTNYLPNVLVYLHTLSAPLQFLSPTSLPADGLELRLASADTRPISPDRIPQIQIYSAPNLTPPVLWTRLNHPLVSSNGWLRVEGISRTNPAQFFQAVELP